MNENYGVHVVKFPANWTLRFVVAVLASAMLMSGAIVGMAPQAWRILNAHEEVPVELGGFGGLATRSQILGLNGRQKCSRVGPEPRSACGGRTSRCGGHRIQKP